MAPNQAAASAVALNRRGPLLATMSLGATALAVTAAVVAMLLTWKSIVAIGGEIVGALWLMPLLIALHLFQLSLAGSAWWCLLSPPAPRWSIFYRLRIAREGIDSLLPVAQVGGEIIGARLLAKRGVQGSLAAASVVVDVTVELLTHVIFLLCGLAAVAMLAPAADMMKWLSLSAAAGLTAAGLLMAQRFGGLRLLELLVDKLAGHYPALASVASLSGLHDAALRMYRQPVPMLSTIALHLAAWFIGALESWAVLNALGVATSPLQAFAIESLGMAARSAGFAVPGALGLQEGGFVLAALAVGLPPAPALALSLVKRIREISVGLIGLVLWRLDANSRSC